MWEAAHFCERRSAAGMRRSSTEAHGRRGLDCSAAARSGPVTGGCVGQSGSWKAPQFGAIARSPRSSGCEPSVARANTGSVEYPTTRSCRETRSIVVTCTHGHA